MTKTRMKNLTQLLNQANYFYKLAAPDDPESERAPNLGLDPNLPFFNELLKAAVETTKDFREELVQLAQLYKAAVDSNSGFDYVKDYINRIFNSHFNEDEDKDDEMDTLEDLLTEVYDDAMDRADNEVAGEEGIAKFKDTFRAIKKSGLKGDLDSGTFDKREYGKGFDRGGKALKDYVAAYDMQKSTYQDRLENTTSENDKKIISNIMGVLDQLIPARKEYDELSGIVATLEPGQGQEDRAKL